MARLFISYAHRDAVRAEAIRELLAANGHKVFLDHDLDTGIIAGEEWQKRLHEQLRFTDAVVCIVTGTFVASMWCGAEVAVAQSRGIRLLPIQVEPHADHPMLRSIQHIPGGSGVAALREPLLATLRRLDVGPPLGWPDVQSPYPGLRAFDADLHRVFFGREQEAAQITALIRAPETHSEGGMVLIVGPSGCGKSSLARAGLLPVIQADPAWLTVPAMIPGDDAVNALARAVATAARRLGLPWRTEDARRELMENGLGGTAEEFLIAAREHGWSNRLLLVIDQFEELLTHTGDDDRECFAKLLQTIRSGPVTVVGTLRSEYLDQLLVDLQVTNISPRIYPLRPLGREALRRVIERPAAEAGISIEDGLAARLVDDTGAGEALPLLAYTLAELADGVPYGESLSWSRYEQLGGVQGALTRQADEALAAAMARGNRSRDEVVAELLRLVTVDDQGRPTRWRLRSDELSRGAMWVLDEFVRKRLLVTYAAEGDRFVSVAHEAILSGWPPLTLAIDANAAGLRARRDVEQAAEEWNREGRSIARLMEGGRLATILDATGGVPRAHPLRRLRRDREPSVRGVELTATAREYLATSSRMERRRRRRATTILSVFLAAALMAAAFALVQDHAAEVGRRLATARLLLTQADTVLSRDPPTAVRLGEAAVATSPSDETRAGLVDLMIRSSFVSAFDDDSAIVWGIAFSPDGAVVATATSTGIVLRDARDPDHPHRLAVMPSPDGKTVYGVAFSPDGRTLAAANSDRTTSLWDVTNPAAPQLTGPPLVGQPGPVTSLVFTIDGTLITLGGGSAILWNARDPRNPAVRGRISTGPTEQVASLAVTADGRTLAILDDTGVDLWDIADAHTQRLIMHDVTHGIGKVGALAFAPNGKVLAAGGDGASFFYDVTDRAHPRMIGQRRPDHTQIISSVAFNAAGTVMATGAADGTANVWDVGDISRPRLLHSFNVGTSRIVLTLAISPDARTLVTVGTQATDLAWDLTEATRPRRLATIAGEPGSTATIAYGQDGRTLAVASRDVILSDVSDPARPRPLEPRLTGLANPVAGLAFAADDRHLAVVRADGGTSLWDSTVSASARDPDPPIAPAGTAGVVAVSVDGSIAAMARKDGRVVVWRPANPADRHELGQPLGAGAAITSLRFSPDSRILAVATNDVALVDITDLANPRLAAALEGGVNTVTAMAFSRDGRVLATGSTDRGVILWDVSNPAAPRRLGDPLTGHINTIIALDFAPDGRTLVTAGADRTFIVWDLSDPAHPHQLGDPVTASESAVATAGFARDGRTLATVAVDGTTTLWGLAGLDALRANPLMHACALTVRGLNSGEWSRFLPDLPFADSCV